VKLRQYRLVVDVNIPRAVMEYLAAEGIEHVRTDELLPEDVDDQTIMQLAYESGAVVLTHDYDFGALAFRDGVPYIGIVFLRPGHAPPGDAVYSIKSILDKELDLQEPFVVAERVDDDVIIRVRTHTR